jgi:predicted transcriptional regulator
LPEIGQTLSIINLARKDNQPFTQIPNQVIRDPRITPNAFRLLAYLMSHKDGYELNYEQIEVQTGMGRYAINEAAKLLVELKWLEVNRPKVDGKFACKQWVVLSNEVNESIAGDSIVESHHMGQSTDNKRTSFKEEQLEKEQLTYVHSDDERVFKEFWKLYPRKQGKGAGRKAFSKALKVVSAEELIAACQRFNDDPNRPIDTKFLPMPATWLNEERWGDDPYPGSNRVSSPEEIKRIEEGYF